MAHSSNKEKHTLLNVYHVQSSEGSYKYKNKELQISLKILSIKYFESVIVDETLKTDCRGSCSTNVNIKNHWIVHLNECVKCSSIKLLITAPPPPSTVEITNHIASMVLKETLFEKKQKFWARYYLLKITNHKVKQNSAT